jgi:hypothetical protein
MRHKIGAFFYLRPSFSRYGALLPLFFGALCRAHRRPMVAGHGQRARHPAILIQERPVAALTLKTCICFDDLPRQASLVFMHVFATGNSRFTSLQGGRVYQAT